MLFIQPVSTIEGQDTDSTSDLLYWSHRSASTVQFKVKTVQQNFLLVSLLSQYSTIQGQDSTTELLYWSDRSASQYNWRSGQYIRSLVLIRPFSQYSTIQGQDNTTELLYWSLRSVSAVQLKVRTVQQNSCTGLTIQPVQYNSRSGQYNRTLVLVWPFSQYSTIQGEDSTTELLYLSDRLPIQVRWSKYPERQKVGLAHVNMLD